MPNDSSRSQKHWIYKKKKTYGYKERNIDNTEDYEYGYCKKGERFHALKSGVKSQLVSMIAALNQRKIIVPLTFEGYCNTELFNAWFEQFYSLAIQSFLITRVSISPRKLVSLPKELVMKFFTFLRILVILMKLSINGFLLKIEQGKISLSLNLSVKLSILPFYELFRLLGEEL